MKSRLINYLFKIRNGFRLCLINFLVAICLIGSTFSPVSPVIIGNTFSLAPSVKVHAADTPPVTEGLNVFGSLGFSECRIKEGASSKPDGGTLQKCVVQIVQFFFIISLFIVVIRIAMEAITGLNPFDKGKAIDNTSKLITDLFTGLLLLGSPALLLTIFNTTTINIDSILNLSTPVQNNTPNDTSNTNGGGANGGGQQQASTLPKIRISGQDFIMGTDPNTITDPAIQQAYKDRLQSIQQALYNGRDQGFETNGINFDEFVNVFRTIGNPESKANATYIAWLNNGLKGATLTQASALSGANPTYSAQIPSCTGNNVECKPSVKIVNIDNGCNSIITNNKIGAGFPTLKCYTLPTYNQN